MRPQLYAWALLLSFISMSIMLSLFVPSEAFPILLFFLAVMAFVLLKLHRTIISDKKPIEEKNKDR